MTEFDNIYKDIVLDIINNGQMQSGDIRPKYEDGTPAYTKYIYNVNFELKPEDGFPILQSKRVAFKTAVRELDWIWRQMDNNVDKLEDMGVKVWSEWKKEDGTIGPSYGARLGHEEYRKIHDENGKSFGALTNQVQFVLNQIKNNPRSRRIMTTLYETKYLNDMALEPCVWTTNWNVDDNNKLHLFVKQRSGDIVLGVPFNISQYAVLHRRIAQVTGRELGSMYWTIDNAHIYDRHLDLIEEQVSSDTSQLPNAMKLILPNSLDYFNTPLDNIELENYVHNGSYKYEIAI